MDLADGYAVQAELCRRWQADGRRLTGYKGGLTSKAKMVQMGLETPVFGVLMGDTCVPDGDVVDMSRADPPQGRGRDRVRHLARAVRRCLHRRSAGRDGVRAAGNRGDRLAVQGLQVRHPERDRRQHVGGALRGRRIAATARRARPAPARRRDGTQRRVGRQCGRRCGDGPSRRIGRRAGSLAGRQRPGVARGQSGDDRRRHRSRGRRAPAIT